MTQNFVPVLSREEYIKRSQKRLVNKTSSGIGFLIFIYYCFMVVASLALYAFMYITGKESISLDYLLYFNIFTSVLIGFVPGMFYFLLSKNNLNDIIKADKTPIKTTAAVLFVGFAVCMTANTAASFFISNAYFWGIENNISSELNPQTLGQVILMIISSALVPAFIEEFVFRGIIVGVLRKYGDAFAIISSAVLFGLMHRNITQTPFAFIVGLVLAFVYCKTNSLIPCILIHFCNNLFAVISQIFLSSDLISEKTFYVIYELITALFFIIGIIGFMYLIKKDRKFFKVSYSSYSADFYQSCGMLTLKDKMKEFFINVGIILAISILLLESIANTKFIWIM